MTHLSLENYGVSNLEAREMRTTNGGGDLVEAILAGIVGYIIGRWIWKRNHKN